MKKIFIGIDNGVTGAIGVITPRKNYYIKTPVIDQIKYTKKKGSLKRFDFFTVRSWLLDIFEENNCSSEEVMTLLERPAINNQRGTNNVASAARCHEATLILLEDLGVAFEVIDSKEWQSSLLQAGSDTKKASLMVGDRLFPEFKVHPKVYKYQQKDDRDGILMAEYCRRKFG